MPPRSPTAVESAVVGAAAGNVAGQVTANLAGIQDAFDFGSFATSVLSAGITQGIARVSGLDKAAAGFNLSTAARAGISSVVNQGLNIVVGRQDKFDWKGVAAAAIAAPIAAGTLNSVSGAAEFDGTRIPEVDPRNIDFGSRFAGGLAGGTAAAIVRMAVYGGGKMNFSSVAADAFGNAIGNSGDTVSQIAGTNDPRVSTRLRGTTDCAARMRSGRGRSCTFRRATYWMRWTSIPGG